MKFKAGKRTVGAITSPATSNPEAKKAPDLTARMQFYAVHNEGEQLRRGRPGRTTGRHERMVGR